MNMHYFSPFLNYEHNKYLLSAQYLFKNAKLNLQELAKFGADKT